MSMLAERRRKQRWSLNPRGKLWAEDSNTFGQKMMQKMGWKHGKGLGANEDGMIESLKVSYKNDSKGMGYKEVEQWTAHDDNFSTLLQSLNGNVEHSSNVKEITSLEEKSQNCRTRIHYHKFTKGKDLSKYSEKDIASIFGKKTLKQNTIKENANAETGAKPVKIESDTSLINKGSMVDYFKKKLPNFGKNNSNYVIGNNGVLTKEVSDSENERVGFGFAQNKRKRIEEHEETAINDENMQQNNANCDEKKKQKRKKMDENFISYVYEDNINEEGAKQDAEEETIIEGETLNAKDAKMIEYTQQNNEGKNGLKKKKKDKRKLKENFVSYVCEDKETNVDLENDDKELEESGNIVKQKKKKKKSKLDHSNDENICKREDEDKCEERLVVSNINEENNVDERSKKKSKKLKLTNSTLEEKIADINDEESNIKTKKKKNRNDTLISTIQNDSENNVGIEGNKEESFVVDEEYTNNKKKRKSKKKKKEEIDIGISNPAFNDFNYSITSLTDSLQIADQEKSTPVEKKSADTSDTSANPYEVKTKKKKSDREGIGLDNPALNLSDVVLDTDLMLNIVNTPVILKKPVQASDIISSIERIKRTKRKSVRFSDVLQERIIPNDPSERSNEYITNRNELFDINTMVIEESIKEDMEKQGLVYQNCSSSPDISNANDQADINRKVVESSVQEELSRAGSSNGFINNGFDIRSVDKVNFYECKYEVRSPVGKGIDNKAFNKFKNQIEENVETISNTIERYQAEVENDINECKDNLNNSNCTTPNRNSEFQDWLVGDVGEQIDRNIKVDEGLKLCFKNMHFKTQVPGYMRNSVNTPRKTYRHLIRGDITLAFKNSNLHEIRGYAVRAKEKTGFS